MTPVHTLPPARALTHRCPTLPRQYTLHTKLGDGMTATVFVAFDKHSKRTCACKLAERKARQPNWSRLVKAPASHEPASPVRPWPLPCLAAEQSSHQ